MKTAEEVAVSIINEIKQYFDTYRLPKDEQYAYKLSAQKCIEHHLTAFAEEASLNTKGIMNMMIRKARAEALEEAAKIVENQDLWTDKATLMKEINTKIRALKNKP